MPKSKAMCSGCHDDFYNHNRDGGCWRYNKAMIVTRSRVGTWQPPPYTWHPEKVLSCYNGDGIHFLTKDDCRFVHNGAKA